MNEFVDRFGDFLGAFDQQGMGSAGEPDEADLFAVGQVEFFTRRSGTCAVAVEFEDRDVCRAEDFGAVPLTPDGAEEFDLFGRPLFQDIGAVLFEEFGLGGSLGRFHIALEGIGGGLSVGPAFDGDDASESGGDLFAEFDGDHAAETVAPDVEGVDFQGVGEGDDIAGALFDGGLLRVVNERWRPTVTEASVFEEDEIEGGIDVRDGPGEVTAVGEGAWNEDEGWACAGTTTAGETTLGDGDLVENEVGSEGERGEGFGGVEGCDGDESQEKEARTKATIEMGLHGLTLAEGGAGSQWG